jgi:hypothetical protein
VYCIYVLGAADFVVRRDEACCPTQGNAVDRALTGGEFSRSTRRRGGLW